MHTMVLDLSSWKDGGSFIWDMGSAGSERKITSLWMLSLRYQVGKCQKGRWLYASGVCGRKEEEDELTKGLYVSRKEVRLKI